MITRERAITILEEWCAMNRDDGSCLFSFGADMDEVEEALKMAVNVLKTQDFRVPSTDEWMERFCTPKQLAGYAHRNADREDFVKTTRD